MNTNKTYTNLLYFIQTRGMLLKTRNAETYSCISLPRTTFTQFPLVTWRQTAWRKAIREMEWFMSGDSKCPDELLDWWKGQLNPNNELVNGYPKQFRHFTSANSCGCCLSEYDQVKGIFDGLSHSPNSRRLIMTVWNPKEMAEITKTNQNPATPTCCHSIVVQFFVRDGKLSMTTYQRSADMLLGVPHNWVQSWAMLLYFAYHAGLEVGEMNWDFGDAHIYNEESHRKTVEEFFEQASISSTAPKAEEGLTLVYSPENIEYDESGVPVFKTSDFSVQGVIPQPVIFTKPKLL